MRSLTLFVWFLLVHSAAFASEFIPIPITPILVPGNFAPISTVLSCGGAQRGAPGFRLRRLAARERRARELESVSRSEWRSGSRSE